MYKHWLLGWVELYRTNIRPLIIQSWRKSDPALHLVSAWFRTRSGGYVSHNHSSLTISNFLLPALESTEGCRESPQARDIESPIRSLLQPGQLFRNLSPDPLRGHIKLSLLFVKEPEAANHRPLPILKSAALGYWLSLGVWVQKWGVVWPILANSTSNFATPNPWKSTEGVRRGVLLGSETG